MKKNSYIKILLLFIGAFVRLQASASNTAQQASEGNMVQAASLLQEVSGALTNVRFGLEPNINKTFKDQAQKVMLQFPEITSENIAKFVFAALDLYSDSENQSKVTGKPVGEITKDFSKRLQKSFWDLIESTPAFQASEARYQVFKLLKEEIFDELNIRFDSEDLEHFLKQEPLAYLKQITSKSAGNSAEYQADLIKLAEDFIKASFVPIKNNPEQGFIQLSSIYDNLNKLGDSESLDNDFINKKIDILISQYPDFFKKIENYSSGSALFDNLLKENKNFKIIRATTEVEALFSEVIDMEENPEILLSKYISLKEGYDNILERYQLTGDTILAELFDKKIKPLSELPLVIAYNNYQESLSSFLELKSINLTDVTSLKTLAEAAKQNLKLDLNSKELTTKVLAKVSNNPLSKFIISNILINKPNNDEAKLKMYAKAIESLFEKFKINFDLSKVENFLETGNVPEDRWFKNVFTKMKRAFGLSKDVDIVDVTNLLKILDKSKLLNAQSSAEVKHELETALLKDPALMYKLLPENAKFFIKQFDNIKGFKNKLLEAYFKDKANYDNDFEDKGAKNRNEDQTIEDQTIKDRSIACGKLFQKAFELSLESPEKDTIITALDRNFSKYGATKFSAFNLQSEIVEAFKGAEVDLSAKMIGYEKFNQAAIQVAAGQGDFYEDLGGIRNPNNPTPRPWDWVPVVVTDPSLNGEPVQVEAIQPIKDI